MLLEQENTMSFSEQDWKKCKKCGSYIPIGWQRCGQCGCPVHVVHGRGKLLKLIILLLVLACGYFYRGKLLALISRIDDRINNVSSQWTNEQGAVRNLSETNDLKGEERIEKSAYDRIHTALLAGQNMIMIPPGIEFSQVSAMIEKIVVGDPNILFYTSCTYRSDGLLSFKYSKPKEFIQKAGEELNRKAEEIISEIIKPGMTDFEKELAIHDYIVNHCRYDVENYEAENIPPESHSAYGVLVKEIAVCEGYAKAMKLLMDKAGVESLVIAGSSKAQSHAWNLVKLDGAYYHVDATWDDPITEDGEQILLYNYFNLTDDEIGTDHSWEVENYPSCYSTDYNYFVHNGLVVSSAEEFTRFLLDGAQKGKSTVTVKIANYSDESYNVPELIRKVATILGSGASYSVDDYGVVEVWFGI